MIENKQSNQNDSYNEKIKQLELALRNKTILLIQVLDKTKDLEGKLKKDNDK